MSTSGLEYLAEIRQRGDYWREHLSDPIQLPDASMVLNLESRSGSMERSIRHLQQMCMLHRENYWKTNQLRHMYLVDAFIAAAREENPFALSAIARSIFELSAFLHEVQRRLADTAAAATRVNWRQTGEKFFGVLIRARYSTGDPEKLELLHSEGVPTSRLKPFNITNCVKSLASNADHEDAIERYCELSDFVHHNLSGAAAVNSGSAVRDFASSSHGGRIYSAGGPITVTQYEYPAPSDKFAELLDEITPNFLRDVLASVEWLNQTPAVPFDSRLLTDLIGDAYGYARLD